MIGWKSFIWKSLILSAVLLCCVLRGLSSGDDLAERDAVLVNFGWADERSCAECHDQSTHFEQTGHARSLVPASEAGSVEQLRELNEFLGRSETGLTLETTTEQVLAHHTIGPVRRSRTLTWCVGSGDHARTWISTFEDVRGQTSMLEFRWSQFSNPHVFDVTPGQPQAPVPDGDPFGVLFDSVRTQRCFSCHASFIPVSSGRIEEVGIVAGIRCQRCHGARQDHVTAARKSPLSKWKPENRDEAVKRCAQCHRSVDDVEPESITPDNVANVRFAPVGLSQSACFQKSNMTCSTCHDVHRPLHEQDSKGIWQCIQCHNPEVPDHRLCAGGFRDDCLNCHMPVRRQDSPLRLTDHWIRIRQEQE